MKEVPKILILYSMTGSGHRSVSEAIKIAIKDQNPDAEVILEDGLKREGFDPAKYYDWSVKKGRRQTNLTYRISNNPLLGRLGAMWVNWKSEENIYKLVNKHQPDVVVSTHFEIRPEAIPDFQGVFVNMVTNLYPHYLEIQPNARLVLVPTKEAEARAKSIVDDPTRVILTGFPIRPGFVQTAPPENDQILVLSGGKGQGRIPEQINNLVEAFPGRRVIVVCGDNENLREKIQAKYPQVNASGYVKELDKMVKLVKDARVVVSKPGAGSIWEVSSVGRPMVVTDWVGAWERSNINFITGNHLGIYTPDISMIGDAIDKIEKNYYAYIHPELFAQNAAQRIAEVILDAA